MKRVSLSLSLLHFLMVCVVCHVAKAFENAEEQQSYSDTDLQGLTLGHSYCGFKQDSGTCKATLERFYFNIYSRQCESFEYGGCEGNENNFQTAAECQEKCIVPVTPPKKKRGKFKQEKPAFCFLEEDSGICRGLISRYFYNKESEKCEMFKYGGCLGNANNFLTLEDCQITCQGEMTLVSNAQEELPEKINHSSPVETSIASARIMDFHGPSVCQKPPVSGNCKEREKRFYYHQSNRKCLPFVYTGCGGNENNFNSRKSCLKVCRKDSMKIRRKKKKESLKPPSDTIIIEFA